MYRQTLLCVILWGRDGCQCFYFKFLFIDFFFVSEGCSSSIWNFSMLVEIRWCHAWYFVSESKVFHGLLNELHPAFVFTCEPNDNIFFRGVLVHRSNLVFQNGIGIPQVKFYRIKVTLGLFVTQTARTEFNKSSLHQTKILCSQNKLNPEITFLTKVLVENGYQLILLQSCICTKIATFIKLRL